MIALKVRGSGGLSGAGFARVEVGASAGGEREPADMIVSAPYTDEVSHQETYLDSRPPPLPPVRLRFPRATLGSFKLGNHFAMYGIRSIIRR